MKRWLVAVLVVLALLVLLAPGIVGRLAERNIAENIEWAEADSPGVHIETEAFERGWFTSQGRYRVGFDALKFGAAAAEYQAATGNAELPSLIVDTRLQHGPLPGGSMPPGLANTVSTFQIDPGNGQLVNVPGQLTSQVALDGTSDARLLVEAGSYEHEEGTIAWQGADLAFVSNPASGAVTVNGEVSPWSITAENEAVNVGAMSIAADQARSEFGFNVGTVDFSIGKSTIMDEGATTSIEGIELTGASSIEDGRVDADSTFALKKLTIPAVGDVDFDMDISLRRVDAQSAAVIGKALQDAQGAADPEAALAGVYDQVEPDLQTLFQRGFSVNVERFDVSLPQGAITSKVEVEVSEAAEDTPFSWGTVLLATTASIDLRIPGAIYEMASMMNAQAGSLVAMGFLVADGDDFVMAAEYAQGLVTINGAPMPIPMPAPGM
jgi:uncharacterized protein YdgA (DUF945 family)